MKKTKTKITILLTVFILVGYYLAYPVSTIMNTTNNHMTVYATQSKPKSSSSFKPSTKTYTKPKTSTIKPDSGSFSTKPNTNSNTNNNSSSSSNKNYNDYDDYGGGKSYIPSGGSLFGGYNPFYRMSYGFGISPFMIEIVTILVGVVIAYMLYDYFKNRRD